VWCQVKVRVEPTGVTRQPLLSSSSSANWGFPPLQLLSPGDHQDAGLLSLGAAVEQRLDAWRAPTYLPTLPPEDAR
jgi:amidase